MPEKITAEKAKQGRKGTHTLVVLMMSVMFALVAWGPVEIYARTSTDTGSAPPVNQREP